MAKWYKKNMAHTLCGLGCRERGGVTELTTGGLERRAPVVRSDAPRSGR